MLSVYRDFGVVRKESRDDNFNQTAEDRSIYQLVDVGWLLVNRMKAWQGSLGVSLFRGIVSGHYICFRPEHDEDPRFINYLLRSPAYAAELRRSSRGVRPSQIEIDNDRLRVLPIHLPTTPEQRAIADYLDIETARIDALIHKKRRMIELVAERFEVWVRGTLRSLTPVVPLKRFWTVTDCKHRTPSYVDAGYPVVSPGDVSRGRLDLTRAHRFVDEDDFRDLADGPRRPRRGDIVYSRNASIGIAAYVDTDEAFCMGQDVCLITSVDCDQLFLSYVLNSLGADQLDVQKLGSTFSRANVEQILELAVPAPELDHQRSVAAAVDAEKQRQMLTELRLSRQIDLLVERRQALITAAVTGELAIPGVAP